MFFLSIAGLWLGLQQPLVDNELEARWRREYPAAAASLKADLDRFLCRGKLEYRFLQGDIETTGDFVIAGSGAKRAMIRRDIASKNGKTGLVKAGGSATVQVRTHDYWFDLDKRAGAEAYLIKEYTLGRPSRDVVFEGLYEGYAWGSFWMGRGSLADDMNSADFNLTSIQRKQVDGRDIIRVEYYIPKGDMIFHYDADLDPSRNWVKTRWGFRAWRKEAPPENFRPYTDIKLQYVEFSPGHFLPRRMESHVQMKDPKVFQHVVAEFDKVIPGEPPEEMFKLSGYGLPDIPLSAEPPPNFFSLKNPIFWVCLGVAGASLGLLGFLRRKGTTSTNAGASC